MATAQSFDSAAEALQKKLEKSIEELAALRARIAEEKIPLGTKLSELESKLLDVRLEHQQTTRMLDSRALDLSNLRNEIKSRKAETTYLGNVLGEYRRNFETRIHIAERQRYASSLEQARLAEENRNLSRKELYDAQLQLVGTSLGRIEDGLGGTRFEGRAVGTGDLVQTGQFVLLGPVAIFKAKDGKASSVETRIDSLEPIAIAFTQPELQSIAGDVVDSGHGTIPVDPTLGNARKIEATQETLWQEIQKGGLVMVPIFVLAGLSLLIALFKWISLVRIPRPSKKRIAALLDAVQVGNQEEARERVKKVRGPVGRMLGHGVEHMKESKALVEEILYESVLRAKLRLQRMLPFIAISAAAAPLLGLLGTVTGIINTFKMITLFGTGNASNLSGGISEALITTKYGLIVAIPSLLLHAFLSRKARGIVGQMETNGVAFVNHLRERPDSRAVVIPAEGAQHHATPDPAVVKRQVDRILREMLDPVFDGGDSASRRGTAKHN